MDGKAGETVENAQLYCVCRSSYSGGFMIQCDRCEEWFHGSCVGLSEAQSSQIEEYHCSKCTAVHGPMKFKARRNVQRHNYVDLEAGRVSQTVADRLVFLRQLQTRVYTPGAEIVECLTGPELDEAFLEARGFARPMIVLNKEGLGLKVPPPDFSISDVEQHIGPLRELNVIDVAYQEDSRMHLHEWTTYFSQPPSKRSRTLNVISLEFSDTKLSALVRSPSIVRKIDWLDQVWPQDSDGLSCRPKIQKYVLMGTQGSYTDFHIDFGGSSVWYHVLWGQKIFYLIKPTPKNLELFAKWSMSPNQNEVFFGDQVETCYECRVNAGETFFIPTGWIHAVSTPKDSLVFGGNFLHSYNMLLQLWIYGMETRIRMQARLLLPSFETLHWYAAKDLLANLKRRVKACRDHHAPVLPLYLYEGARTLHHALVTWTSEEGLKHHKAFFPESMDTGRVVHGLGRVLRSCESEPTPLVVTSATNPLKLKINSRALQAQEMRRTEAESSTCDLKIRLPPREQPVATVKAISPTTIKLRLIAKPESGNTMESSHNHGNSKVSLAGWERVQHGRDVKSEAEDSDSTAATTTSDSDSDDNAGSEDGGEVADSNADTGVTGNSNGTLRSNFEMASPGLVVLSLPVHPAGDEEAEENSWLDQDQEASNKRKRDRTRGTDNNWHPGARLDVTSTKSSKKTTSKPGAPSAKRPCKTPSSLPAQPPACAPPIQRKAVARNTKAKKGYATARERIAKKLKMKL